MSRPIKYKTEEERLAHKQETNRKRALDGYYIKKKHLADMKNADLLNEYDTLRIKILNEIKLDIEKQIKKLEIKKQTR
jgi:hypothetical protein